MNFTIENIKFYDYFDPYLSGTTSLFFIHPLTPYLTVNFKNCTFESSNINLFRYNIDNYMKNDNYQFSFDYCKFM